MSRLGRKHDHDRVVDGFHHRQAGPLDLSDWDAVVKIEHHHVLGTDSEHSGAGPMTDSDRLGLFEQVAGVRLAVRVIQRPPATTRAFPESRPRRSAACNTR